MNTDKGALYGLLGYPLGHSFSARYFAEKFEKEGVNARYVNFEYANVADAIAYFESLPELRGFNVTIPHKQAIMPYLHALSDEARAIGAVNVVKVQRMSEGEMQLVGYNSDCPGFMRSISPLLDDKIHKRALVLGTGGASKAVVHGLKLLNVEPLYVSRHPHPGMLTYDDLTPEAMRAHLVIVNCSPVGMYPHMDEAPAIPYELLTPEHVLYDLVYNPLETRFMQLGGMHGATVKNGLEMLHLQAEIAWNIWQRGDAQID